MQLKKIAADNQAKDIWSVQNKGVLINGEQKATFDKLSKAKSALSPEEDARLQKACKDFESFFLYYLLKQMRTSIPKDEGILEESRAQEFYQDMFDEKIADKIAQSKGMGLGATLYRQIKDSLLNKADITVDKKG